MFKVFGPPGCINYFPPMLPAAFPYCLAPMDSLTNPVFRRLVAAFLPPGIPMAFFSPAINPNDLLHKSSFTKETVPVNPGETLFYNLMHGDPEIVVSGMELLLKNNPVGFTLNCGCPRRKIQKADHFPIGAALMGHPERVAAIVRCTKKRFPAIHFSVKIRAGLTHNPEKLFDFCTQIEDAGTDAIIFHARTARDQFTHPARHELFGELKQRVRVPLIGNGDILTDAKAMAVMADYGLDGVMIGRGALLTPAVFRAIALRIAGTPAAHPVMAWEEKRDFLLAYARETHAEYGRPVMVNRVRLLARWFCKGVAFGQTLLGNVHRAKTLPEMEAAVLTFFETPKAQYAESLF